MGPEGPQARRDERLEALVRQYGRLIAAVIARVGGARVAAVKDDVEQEVVVSLWKQIEREPAFAPSSSYVYTAAVRETVRAIRREQGRRQEPLDAVAHRAAGVADGLPDGPFQAVQASERGRQIESCLAALGPDRQRAVRAHLSGFEVSEIILMYGWSYQKARNLIQRGMTELRALLRAKGLS